MDISSYLEDYGKKAKKASYLMACAGGEKKNEALAKAAELLKERAGSIIAENEKDLKNAIENGIRPQMIDRLRLTEKRIDDMATGIHQLVGLKDPVGEVIGGGRRPNGLEIIKKRVPLGVLGIIFEARPNVTCDAAGLCVKSGNACILRGGKEAILSNLAIAKVFREALASSGLPEEAVQLIDNTDREIANGMMKLDNYIDVLIPRGGAGLIKNVLINATVPVIRTGTGNCHVFVDESADQDMAVNIIINAKTQRPSVCNAEESLLVHKKIAGEFLPKIAKELISRNVELRVCERTAEILKKAGIEQFVPAKEEDWATEYDDLILAVRVVDSCDEAIDHINRYGTMHSEAIITESYENGKRFTEQVDAACVYINASTRFTDGFEFGLGAEIGISNQKLHARGPMGLEELTTVKYIINGEGQIRK
ncbi:MAG: glutamate-5-semialdehyde dehydrogenase [Clostridia bacterium]|nr:glutamate-5-semialdehyde dehydrogenase [Clostridia bacterium]